MCLLTKLKYTSFSRSFFLSKTTGLKNMKTTFTLKSTQTQSVQKIFSTCIGLETITAQNSRRVFVTFIPNRPLPLQPLSHGQSLKFYIVRLLHLVVTRTTILPFPLQTTVGRLRNVDLQAWFGWLGSLF